MLRYVGRVVRVYVMMLNIVIIFFIIVNLHDVRQPALRGGSFKRLWLIIIYFTRADCINII